MLMFGRIVAGINGVIGIILSVLMFIGSSLTVKSAYSLSMMILALGVLAIAYSIGNFIVVKNMKGYATQEQVLFLVGSGIVILLAGMIENIEIHPAIGIASIVAGVGAAMHRENNKHLWSEK